LNNQADQQFKMFLEEHFEFCSQEQLLKDIVIEFKGVALTPGLKPLCSFSRHG
jgi:hypothetical protein